MKKPVRYISNRKFKKALLSASKPHNEHSLVVFSFFADSLMVPLQTLADLYLNRLFYCVVNHLITHYKHIISLNQQRKTIL